MTIIANFYKKHRWGITRTAALLAVVVGIYLIARYLLGYVAPFIVGLVLSLILNPAATWLNKRCKIPRGIAAAALVVVFFGIVSFIVGFATVKLAEQVGQFVENLPKYAEEAMATTQNAGERLRDVIPDAWEENFDKSFDGAFSNVAGQLASSLGAGVGKGGVNVVKSIPGGILFAILSVLSAFFFIKDKQLFDKMLRDALERHTRVKNALYAFKEGIFDALGGYLKAQLIVGSVSAAIATLGLAICGFRYAFLVGLCIGIVDALPIFGSGTVLWPWAAYCFIAGQYGFGVGLLIIYACIFLTRQTLEPRILGAHIGIHPLLVLISIYVGLRVLGGIGVLIGPIVAVCIKIVTASNFSGTKHD